MLITTTPTIEGQCVLHYRGLVTGEVIIGANIVRDYLASIRDVIGGRSRAYEASVEEAQLAATAEMELSAKAMGANAVIGVDMDYQAFGARGMMLVCVSGTAVVLDGQMPQRELPPIAT
ncbi:MAG: YbjQ family protein [Synechococcus sp.]